MAESLPIKPETLEVKVGEESPSLIDLFAAVIVRVTVEIEIVCTTLDAAA